MWDKSYCTHQHEINKVILETTLSQKICGRQDFPISFFEGYASRHKPHTIATLKDAIRDWSHWNDTLVKVFKNLQKVEQVCLDVGGKHFQYWLWPGPVLNCLRYVHTQFIVNLSVSNIFTNKSLGPLARESFCISQHVKLTDINFLDLEKS